MRRDPNRLGREWRDASFVTEATQFQAQAFNELLPSSGPVRTVIMGRYPCQAGTVRAGSSLYELLYYE